MKNKNSGWTLVELLLTIMIFSIITLGTSTFMTQGIRNMRLVIARIDIQREARISLSIMNKELRQAVQDTIVISRQNALQPPYSKITFETIKGSTVSYYQDGIVLYQEVWNGNKHFVAKLSENLRFVHFVYPRTDDSGIIQVSACFEKIPFPYVTGAKALQVSIEKVRIMND
jgi:prepilin-type N-terminal cleavage/methylation domain-containing protein